MKGADKKVIARRLIERACPPAWIAQAEARLLARTSPRAARAAALALLKGMPMIRPTALVVGSGAGGCAAAKELSATHDATLLEAGNDFSDSPGAIAPSSLSARRVLCWMSA